MALFSFLFGSEKNKSVFLIDTHELKEAVTQHNVQLIDLRTPNEYSSGHIDKAINIDFLNQNGFKAAFSKLDKKKPLYLYCRSGNRSSRAAKQLAGLGFEKIYDLKGGYMKWRDQ
ncbi:rhodanese-like domain-containing protein [Flavobacteriaceae bacterium]|jgi:rhodanese-related sulfurtransferase|nr:rhodanese-like domain-containing protein [Flavobacteriaceae bacterium]MDB4325492.1 rhodanese-like domain-containing protein [Flavobacteriaceae bacterium]